jgi:hypothetical protein
MITTAAQRKGVSRSEVVIKLIKKVMDDIENPGRMGQMIQYQKRRKPGNWHKFHLSLREDEYEYFLDLRKLKKMSVSLILAYAVEKFLNEFMRKKGTDNYRYNNYIIAKELMDNIICWKFIWGFPPNLEKLTHHA